MRIALERSRSSDWPEQHAREELGNRPSLPDDHGSCQWQPKTAHLWQLKTAHSCRGGRGGIRPPEQGRRAPVSAVGCGATGGRHRLRDEAGLPVDDHEPESW